MPNMSDERFSSMHEEHLLDIESEDPPYHIKYTMAYITSDQITSHPDIKNEKTLD